eukprot:gene20474-27262_t
MAQQQELPTASARRNYIPVLSSVGLTGVMGLQQQRQLDIATASPWRGWGDWRNGTAAATAGHCNRQYLE